MYQSTPVPEMKETVQFKNPHAIRDLDTEYNVLSQKRDENYTHTHTHSISGTKTIKSKMELFCTALKSLLMFLASQYSDSYIQTLSYYSEVDLYFKKIAYCINDDMSFLICHLGYKLFPFSLFSSSVSLSFSFFLPPSLITHCEKNKLICY